MENSEFNETLYEIHEAIGAHVRLDGSLHRYNYGYDYGYGLYRCECGIDIDSSNKEAMLVVQAYGHKRWRIKSSDYIKLKRNNGNDAR
jgi:hypothetical protein